MCWERAITSITVGMMLALVMMVSFQNEVSKIQSNKFVSQVPACFDTGRKSAGSAERLPARQQAGSLWD
jgi:hypothetical protein